MTVFFYILAGVFVLILILAFLAPKTYNISRSIEIRQPKARVFEYLRFLKNQEAWSPWEKKDPNMVKQFRGTDGEVGAISSWQGNREVGEGEQELTNIIPGERVESELRFFKPWKSTSSAYLVVEETSDNGSRVIWGFSGRNKFPMSIMMLFMNMDKMVGRDFEEGLAALKAKLEGEGKDIAPGINGGSFREVP